MQGRHLMFGLLIFQVAACQRAELQNLKDQVRTQKEQLVQCQLESHHQRGQLVKCADAQIERDQLRSQLTQVQGNLADAQKRLDRLHEHQEHVENRLTQFSQLATKLTSISDVGKLEFSIRDGQTILSFPDRVLFDVGRAKITMGGQSVLGQVAKALHELKGRRFQVVGHADQVPVPRRQLISKWDLSVARAVEVIKFLIEHEVEESRLIAVGEVDSPLIVSNESEGMGTKSFGTEIVLLPNRDELSGLNGLEK